MGVAKLPLRTEKEILRVQAYLQEDAQKGIEDGKDEDLRFYMLFMLGISTGFRTGDLICLTILELEQAVKLERLIILENKREKTRKTKKKKKALEDNEVKVTTPKKPREWKLQKDMQELILEYIRGKKKSSFAFPSRIKKGKNKGYLTVETYLKKLKEVSAGLGIDGIGSHTPRKTFAYAIYLEMNKDLSVVQEALGHEDIKTTIRYLGIDQEFKDMVSDKVFKKTVMRI